MTMTLTRLLAGGCLAALALVAASPAQAGWDNVFRTTCWHHRCCPSTSSYYTPAYSAYYSDPCCNPCPQQVCTTRYVQRSYYQPVTCYQTKSYYEPVTSYRTSYYYAPVTTYRYSCYYDPCTCTTRSVATPCTHYELKSQCCAVQSWVQRCCQVPVTTYRQVCYWEPQTCCSLVDPCTGAVISNGTRTAPIETTPAVPADPAVPAQPGVSEFRGNGTSSPLYNKTYPGPVVPEGSGSSYQNRTQRPALDSAPTTTAPKAPIQPRYDRIAIEDNSGNGSALTGRVIRNGDKAPKAGTQVMFIPDAATGTQETTTTDADGRFRVNLASGNWLIYVRDTNGKAVLHSQVAVGKNELKQVTLVSR
jgi:carboxypeptidase family protein